MLLSLERRHHVLRIHLNAPDPVMQRMFIPLDEEFPLLDHLSIITHSPVAFTEVTLPNSLRAPKLRNLFLDNVDLQIGTPILTTSLRLVSLTLWGIPTSTHIPPEYLADLLVLMPQLRAVSLRFTGSSHSTIPRSGVSTHTLLAPEAPKMFFIGATLVHRLQHLSRRHSRSYHCSRSQQVRGLFLRSAIV